MGEGLGFRAQGSRYGFRFHGFGAKLHGLGLRVRTLGFSGFFGVAEPNTLHHN